MTAPLRTSLAHLERIWQEDERRRIEADYAEIRKRLGEGGAVSKAAGIVLDIAKQGRGAHEG